MLALKSQNKELIFTKASVKIYSLFPSNTSHKHIFITFMATNPIILN